MKTTLEMMRRVAEANIPDGFVVADVAYSTGMALSAYPRGFIVNIGKPPMYMLGTVFDKPTEEDVAKAVALMVKQIREAEIHEFNTSLGGGSG